MLWFNFILGLNFIFPCFKVIIIHYHTPKQKIIKFKPRITLDCNIYISGSSKSHETKQVGQMCRGPARVNSDKPQDPKGSDRA